MFALHVPSFEHQSSLLHYLNYPLPNMFFSSRIQSERGSRRNMSEPRLTQTNHFGLNERGAQIGHLENALFNFSMRKDPTGSESDSDVEAKNRTYHGNKVDSASNVMTGCLRSLASGQIYVSRHSGERVP